ncbi:hypothetical protein HIM_06600 [Hirsutella minnesotensis 3608]|uniref:RNase III domain-containing protein n=1 Tax=Hirsutella minnesotensis 3608 TaxID=1043627 RepID=A0A0F7ZZB5_9HYPO|nr:hypothetical protein HIM_06600 [Hirsutella minnesotensis 3608]
MTLQPCRAALSRSRHAYRCLSPSLRTFATDGSSTTTTTTTTKSNSESNAPATQDKPVPRWSQTPPAMKAAVQVNWAKKPENKVWRVNSDPEMLDQMYDRLLGRDGRNMLPEELKWLAITHKSFDQGRRGFNDRLALMGRMALVTEAAKMIVSKPPKEAARVPDEYGRTPLENPYLASVDNLVVEGPRDLAGREKLAAFAHQMGMLSVVRWKPRLPNKLKSSGVDTVLSSALLAIIGAITMQHGTKVASEVLRTKIIPNLPSNNMLWQ